MYSGGRGQKILFCRYFIYTWGTGSEKGFLGVDDGCIENDRRGLVYVRFGRCWQCVYAPTVLVVSE